MANDQLGLYNQALYLLGERSLASLTENREPRRILDVVWRGAVKFCLEQGQWKFALRTSKLTYSTDVIPTFGYSRAFERPTDCVRLSKMCSDEYLKTPLNASQLTDLVRSMGVPVRDILRQKGTPYDALALQESHWTDAQLIDFIVAHPILMNRPIVVAEAGAKLCRPSEEVLALLPPSNNGPFIKEDGELLKMQNVPHI